MINRPRLALLGTCLVAATALAVVMIVGDRPRWRSGGVDDRPGRAALAYRDAEIPFFQWGTELFTVPLLRGAYGEVVYITQRSSADEGKLVEAAEDLLRRYPAVDFFFAVHGGHPLPTAFQRIAPGLRSHLRLVYTTGCGDLRFGDAWLRAGAKAFVGHAGHLSASPMFFIYFLRRWSEGLTVAEALDAANTQAGNRLGVLDRLGEESWGEALRLPAGATRHTLVEETLARGLGAMSLRVGR